MGEKTHKNLNVWKNSMKLVEAIYSICEELPKGEEYGLKSQLRRAAVSVPTNIAEGAARNHGKEYIQFCYIALGSISELETLLLIVENIYKITATNTLADLEEIRKQLLNFIKYLKSKPI